ncbi:tetratricopeptide repeat protein [Pseudoteredinibacter isoporae]|uniref:tetratricopeptide repeat protein n=1 Tax=Pseudoteredinibacter isoporae TaxID=570281 RepID=UPI0031029D15
MKKHILATIISVFSISVLADQATINDIEDAARQLDTDRLEALSHSPDTYDSALAHYRLAISYNLKADNDAAEDALDTAMESMEALTESEPNNAEAWALLSHIYGTKIGFNPMKGMYYGPKAGKSLAKAKALAPENPRVNLVSGVSDYFSPAVFGGSKTSAIKSLSTAIHQYTSDQSSGYHWGLAEAYVWRGLAQMELGESGKALNDWRSAVAIEPDYHWANSLIQKHQ